MHWLKNRWRSLFIGKLLHSTPNTRTSDNESSILVSLIYMFSSDFFLGVNMFHPKPGGPWTEIFILDRIQGNKTIEMVFVSPVDVLFFLLNWANVFRSATSKIWNMRQWWLCKLQIIPLILRFLDDALWRPPHGAIIHLPGIFSGPTHVKCISPNIQRKNTSHGKIN